MNYSLHKEAEDHFVIGHPDGSTFKVAKNGLSKDQITRIKHMAPIKMADGGEVSEGSDAEDAPFTGLEQDPAEPEDLYTGTAGLDVTPGASAFAAAAPTPGATQPTTGSGITVDPTSVDIHLPQETMTGPPAPPMPNVQVNSPEVPAAKPQESQSFMAGLPPQLQQAYAPTMHAIQGQQVAQARIAQDQARAVDAHIKILEQARQDQAVADKAWMDQAKNISNAVANGKIDPHQYWNSLSTGSKMEAGIGMILGGIGAGMGGGENAALKAINSNIERDIDAQKNNLANKRTLFAQNMAIYKDERAARNASLIDSASILAGSLQRAALAHGTQLAKANADAAIGQIQQQMIPQIMALQMFGMKQKARGQGLDSAENARMLDMDPEYKKTAVEVSPGRFMMTNNAEDAKSARQLNSLHSQISANLEKLDQIGNAPLSMTQKSNEAKVALAELQLDLADLKLTQRGSNRAANEDLIKHVSQMIHDPSSWGQMANGASRNVQLRKQLTHGIETYKQELIPGYRSPLMGAVNGRK